MCSKVEGIKAGVARLLWWLGRDCRCRIASERVEIKLFHWRLLRDRNDRLRLHQVENVCQFVLNRRLLQFWRYLHLLRLLLLSGHGRLLHHLLHLKHLCVHLLHETLHLGVDLRLCLHHRHLLLHVGHLLLVHGEHRVGLLRCCGILLLRRCLERCMAEGLSLSHEGLWLARKCRLESWLLLWWLVDVEALDS